MNIHPFGFHEHLILQMLVKHERILGSSGLEPPTSRLSGARSNQLSYEPMEYAAFLQESLAKNSKGAGHRFVRCFAVLWVCLACWR